MQVTKGLIIADPWIGYILDGSKTWEMRSSETSVRGPFGLIRKGSGAICGVATLADIGSALGPAEMIASLDKHRIPVEMILSGEVAKWNVPWVLADVRPLSNPVPYEHPNGAVTWVNLTEDVSRAIATQLGIAAKASDDSRSSALDRTKAESGSGSTPFAAVSKTSWLVAQTQLTEGNIRNNHFYLRGQTHRFPSDIVGGSNKDARAAKQANIDWGGSSPAVTDIDGEKQFFRARGWIKQFFEETDARPGDWVLVEETGPYRYRVTLKKA